jgi:hypothetical protein
MIVHWFCLRCFRELPTQDAVCADCSSRRGGPWEWNQYEFSTANEDAEQTARDERWHGQLKTEKEPRRERYAYGIWRA